MNNCGVDFSDLLKVIKKIENDYKKQTKNGFYKSRYEQLTHGDHLSQMDYSYMEWYEKYSGIGKQ